METGEKYYIKNLNEYNSAIFYKNFYESFNFMTIDQFYIHYLNIFINNQKSSKLFLPKNNYNNYLENKKYNKRNIMKELIDFSNEKKENF